MGPRILVVEDSATQAEQLCMLLEAEGYSVVLARSGEAALERIAEQTFDLVLSDIVMPGIDGYELCRRVKSRYDVPVVLLTSLADPMDIVRGLEAGGDNYIIKPYDPDHLLARIRRVLDNRHLRRGQRTSMGVNIAFLGSTFTINSDREQILDLLLSGVEDIVRANRALEERQRELAEAHAQLEASARESARAARLSNERARILMQNAGDGIFLLDGDGIIVELNEGAAEMLGPPAEEILYRPLEHFVAPDETAAFMRGLRKLRRERQVVRDRTLLRADGASISVELSASATRLDDEEYLLVIARDVTERREAEQAVRESEERFRQFAENVPQVFWMTSVDTGELLYVSPSFERVWGRSVEEIYSDPTVWKSALHPDDRGRVLEAMANQAIEPYEVEYRIVRPNGEIRWTNDRGFPVRDTHGEVVRVAGVAEDVTASVEAEQALQRAEEQLRQAQKMEAVGRLAGGVAHDFNNLLTSIKGFAQLAADDLGPDHAVRGDLDEVIRSADRAAGLTQQLLAFSRQQVLRPRVVDLNEVVGEMSRMLTRLVGEDVEFRTRLAEDLGPVVADPGQVQQVVMNLAVNARDAMPKGGTLVLETQNVELTDEYASERLDVRPGPYVMLAVSDTGHGMSREVQERIFEPFFTTKEQGKGTGLGLSTVYGIVQQSGGYVWVYSEPGQGTTFKVYLPRADADAAAEETAAADQSVAKSGGGETVLLVEDEAAVRTFARRVLERAGYAVLEAQDGIEALRVLEAYEGPVHLILTDVVMPGLSGAALAAQAEKLRPGTRVLFTSGYAREEVTVRGNLPASITFVEKPYTPANLTRTVREVLARPWPGPVARA